MESTEEKEADAKDIADTKDVSDDKDDVVDKDVSDDKDVADDKDGVVDEDKPMEDASTSNGGDEASTSAIPNDDKKNPGMELRLELNFRVPQK